MTRIVSRIDAVLQEIMPDLKMALDSYDPEQRYSVLLFSLDAEFRDQIRVGNVIGFPTSNGNVKCGIISTIMTGKGYIRIIATTAVENPGKLASAIPIKEHMIKGGKLGEEIWLVPVK